MIHTTLSSALEAIKEARKSGLVDDKNFPSYIGSGNDFRAIYIAAPDALDWIAKALSTLKLRAQEINKKLLWIARDMSYQTTSDDHIIIRSLIRQRNDLVDELATLTALIAQAEGGK